MVNTKHGRFTSAFWRSLGVFLLSLPIAANAVTINNGVPQETIGHLQADVLTGGRSDNLTVTPARRVSTNDRSTENVLFQFLGYLSFVDPGNDGGAFTLVGSDPVRDLNNPNSVTSSGSFLGANQNTILWTAVSSIAPNGQVLTTRYTFDTGDGGALGSLRFLQYLDEDVETFSTNVFFPVGSASNGDLELFTFENTELYGVSQSGAFRPGTELQNAAFAGWAADVFDSTLSVIGQPVSPTGVITNLQGLQHPQLGSVFGPADIVSVLAWDVDPNANTAVITTSLGGIPISAQTVEVRPVGNPLVDNPLRCRGKNCTFQAMCFLPPSPGALCTNQVEVTVSNKALRSSAGASVKARRVPFASGAANVPPGQPGNVRLALRKAGRQFLRSGTKKKLNGVMTISNMAGSTVSVIPFTIRIKR
ncbi:MAG: hypothetical protein ACREA0_05845 [bacterium]